MADLMLTVPQAVQRTALEALELHRTLPLAEVNGVSLATRLTSGLVSVDDVSALHRFFLTNDRLHSARLQEARTPRTDALCRSWTLRGAEHGAVWAAKTYARLCAEGIVTKDPYAVLFAADPDEVYARFAAGAWRWEYGLDTPGKAAIFYESYFLATGKNIDLNAAFGESGKAIANAVHRRMHGEDPMRTAMRRLQSEDIDIRFAARLDLDELHSLDESIKPYVYDGNPKLAAKLIWPSFVAYAILAVEQPELLEELNKNSHRPPRLNQEPLNLLSYHDAIRTYLTYFHPSGSKFVNPVGTDFEGIDAEVEDFITRAYLGKKLMTNTVHKLLGRMRRWTAQNKLAGSLFHVYNADWRKGNWKGILEDIPLDADVRAPFASFSKAVPKPAAGVKLQQTLSDKVMLTAIAGAASEDSETVPPQKPLISSLFAEAANEAETPVGTYAELLDTKTNKRVQVLGFFNIPGDGWSIVVAPPIRWMPDSIAAGRIENGSLKVLKAHKDMAHGYDDHVAAKTPVLTKPSASTPPPAEVPKTTPPIEQDPVHQIPVSNAQQLQTNMHPSVPLPSPFGFAAGDVVAVGGTNYWLLNQQGSFWVAAILRVRSHFVPIDTSNINVDKAKHLAHVSEPTGLVPWLQIDGDDLGPPKAPPPDADYTDLPSVGDTIGDDVVIWRWFTPKNEFAIVVWDADKMILRLVQRALKKVTSAYAPKIAATEVVGDELAGTPDSFAFAEKRGLKSIAPSSVPGAVHDLGDVLAYGDETRIIVGFVRDSDDTPHYVILTPSGKLNIKGIAAGNKQYGPKLSSSKAVIDALQPLPGAKAPPKLATPKPTTTTGKIDGGFKVSAIKDPDAPVTLAVSGMSASVPGGWDDPTPIEEPWLDAVSPNGEPLYAGVIAIIPAGSHIAHGSTVHALSVAHVVLLRPTSLFGGDYYDLFIPKAPVAKSTSMLESAVSGFYLTSGMVPKVVAHLGDFQGPTFRTRIYIGHLIGGSPENMSSSLGSVEIMELAPLDNIEGATWFNRLLMASGHPWQAKAMKAAVDWCVKNGAPSLYVPAQATTSKPVVTKDEVVSAGLTGPSIELEAQTSPWKSLLFGAPFPVTSAMVTALRDKVRAGIAEAPVQMSADRTKVYGPSFGQMFETAQGTPHTAAGYVSWKSASGKVYHYLIGLTNAGLVNLFDAEADGAKNVTVSPFDSAESKSTDPWFSHSEPAVNMRMAAVFQGGLAAGKVNMQTFKLKWLKEAGIPYYAVATTNIVRDLAGLFVPGALSEAQKDAVLGALKARMASTQKKAKSAADKSLPKSVAGPETVLPPAPPVSLKLAPGSLPPSAVATMANPGGATLTDASLSKLSFGSKPSKIVTDEHGNAFLLKWNPSISYASHIDMQASKLAAQITGTSVPVTLLPQGSKVMSMQPFYAEATAVPYDVASLSDADKATVLVQHAFDMFVGNHDGNASNWIRVGAKLVAVDLGQSFKFLLLGASSSLDPTFHPKGNVGEGYAKRLLLAWAKNPSLISLGVFASFKKAIDAVVALTDADLSAALSPIFEAASTPASDRVRILKDLKTLRDNYDSAWLLALRRLRSDFEWPDTSIKAAPVTLKIVPPEQQGIGKSEAATIEQARKAGWRGKSMRVDGPWIENQEVMVREVVYLDGGEKSPATLIHFRLTREAGDRLQAAVSSSGQLQVSEAPAGPQRLPQDVANGIYEKLFAAVKTINFHLNKTQDGAPNQVTVNTAVGMKGLLNDLLESSKGPGSKNGVPNEAINAMSDQYLGYIGTIEYWNANAKDLIGKHTPQFTEFVYEPPPDEAPKQKKPKVVMKLRNQGASFPTITNNGTQIVVENLHKPVVNSSQVSQFVFEDPAGHGKVLAIPTTQSSGLKAGVQGVKGICWGIIPGPPSPHTVAKLLALFGDASGLSMTVATPTDQRILYLSKQVATLQGDGAFMPKSDGTAEVDAQLAAGMSAYRAGNLEKAESILRARLADLAGVPEGEVAKRVEADYAGIHDAQGAGFYRHHKFGWDMDRIKKAVGPGTLFAHRLMGHSSMLAFLQDAKDAVALIANEVKPFYGVVKTGASPSSDFSYGGSQGVFCVLRAAGVQSNPVTLYFDLSLGLRVDVYMVGTGDAYGNVTAQRFTTPNKWSVGKSQEISSGSTGQIVCRHDIDLQVYLRKAVCASAADAETCRKFAKARGWSFKHGSIDSIFVTS